MKNPRILYFINGTTPTPEEFDEANKLGGNVGFRNAQYVNDDDNPEDCDGVAASNPDFIPKPYKDFPAAKEALAAKDKERAEQYRKIHGIDEDLNRSVAVTEGVRRNLAPRQVDDASDPAKTVGKPAKAAANWKPNA